MLRKTAIFVAWSALLACGSDGSEKSQDNATTGDSGSVRDDDTSQEVDSANSDAEADAPDAASSDLAAAAAAADAAQDAGSQGADAGDAGMDAALAHDAATSLDADRSPDATNQSDASVSDADTMDATVSDADTADAAPEASAPDASTPDAGSPDAGSPDAAVVPSFSVTVRRGAAQPIAQVPVFFHSDTGAQLSEHSTGADGRVVSTTTPSMVTIIAPVTDDANPQLFTITQLSAGDNVVVELADATTSTLPGYRVSTPAPLPANTTNLALLGGPGSCAGAEYPATESQPLELAWPTDCPLAQGNSLLAIALNASHAPVGFAFSKNVPAFGNSAAAVTLGAWAAPENVVLTATNLPTASGAAGLVLLWSGDASFDPIGKGPLAMPTGAATRSLNVPTPRGFADQQGALLTALGPRTQQVTTLAVRGAPSLSPTIDFATGLPGAVSRTFERSTPSRPSLSWTNAAPPTNADGSAVLLEWAETWEWPRIQWLVVTASTAVSVKLPELPADRRAFLSNSAVPDVFISHFGSSTQQGYAEFLKEPVRPTLDGSYHLLGRAITPATSLQAVSWIAQ